MLYQTNISIHNKLISTAIICACTYLSGCSSTPDITIDNKIEADKSIEYLSYLRSSEDYIGFDIENNEIKNIVVINTSQDKIKSEADDMHANNAPQKTVFRDCIIVRRNKYAPCSESLNGNSFSVFQAREYDGNIISSTLAVGLSPIPIALDSLSVLGGDTSFENTGKFAKSETKLVINQVLVDDAGRTVVSEQLKKIKSEASEVEKTNNILRVKSFTDRYPGYPDNKIFVKNLLDKKFAEHDIDSVMLILNRIPQYASRDDVISWLRTLNSFQGYKLAFDLTESMEDAKAANQLATTHAERVELEHMALVLMKENKTKAFSLTSDNLDQSSTSHSEGSGFFLQGKEIASNTFSIKIRAINNKETIDLTDGDYNVKVKVKLMVPVHFRRASRWVGNADEYQTDDYVQEVNIPYRHNTDNSKLHDVIFNDVRTAYKDRGIMGGTTEVQMVGAPKVEAEVIDVTYQ